MHILFKISTFENGAMPIVKGNNCQLDCPEKCRWQSWNYQLGNWETDKELSFSCEQEEIDKNSETSDTPLLLIETPAKKFVRNYKPVIYLIIIIKIFSQYFKS